MSSITRKSTARANNGKSTTMPTAPVVTSATEDAADKARAAILEARATARDTIRATEGGADLLTSATTYWTATDSADKALAKVTARTREMIVSVLDAASSDDKARGLYGLILKGTTVNASTGRQGWAPITVARDTFKWTRAELSAWLADESRGMSSVRNDFDKITKASTGKDVDLRELTATYRDAATTDRPAALAALLDKLNRLDAPKSEDNGPEDDGPEDDGPETTEEAHPSDLVASATALLAKVVKDGTAAEVDPRAWDLLAQMVGKMSDVRKAARESVKG